MDQQIRSREGSEFLRQRSLVLRSTRRRRREASQVIRSRLLRNGPSA